MMNTAQKYLLDNKLDDLVLSKDRVKYIYASDAMTKFAEYYQSEAKSLADMICKCMDEVLPQADKLCVDIGLINEMLMKAEKLLKAAN